MNGVRELWAEASADKVGSMAATLAYQFLLALFPLAIFLASLGSFLATTLHAQNPALEVMNRFGTALPGDARSLIEAQLQAVLNARHPGLLSFGIVAALWSAAGGVGATMNAMNDAYDVNEDRPFWKRTAISLGLTVFTGLFVLVAFVLAVAGGALIAAAADAAGLGDAYRISAGVIRFAGILALLVAAVSVLYWAGPSVHLPFRLITPGSVFFVVAWAVASAGFAFYASHFASYNATYGTLGGVVALMVWFYITAYALLFGAEINALVAKYAAEQLEARQRAEAGAGEVLPRPAPGTGFRRTPVGTVLGAGIATAVLARAFMPGHAAARRTH